MPDNPEHIGQIGACDRGSPPHREVAAPARIAQVTRHSWIRFSAQSRICVLMWVKLHLRWIKQHLRIESFFGTSENAAKNRTWIAASVYVIVAIMRSDLKFEESIHTILQFLVPTIIKKTPLNQLIDTTKHQIQPDGQSKQLNLSSFSLDSSGALSEISGYRRIKDY